MSAEDSENAGAEAERFGVRRDLLGHVCHLLHLGVMVYIVLGWVVPVHAALLFYLAFLPLVVVQWWSNKNSCLLNNVEALIRTGRWRDPTNREEGAWLLTLAQSLGIPLTATQVDILTYGIIALLWALAALHLLGW